ncbi:hypothetical protein [Alicyclobacillus sendaiensis]|uniref:hypothetical protein n=1 Tax=Alicyclobacillus sendaiensis TaxID=192387 RepID=UPI000785DD87|nr:hypothetical protein [Alicyclobacillus sendaiensis]
MKVRPYVPYLQNAAMLVVACAITALVLHIPAVDHAIHHIQTFLQEVVHHGTFVAPFPTR